MQIEDRLEAFFTTMNNYENILKVVLCIGAILIAYNYFFYVSLLGLAIGIPLYYYIQRSGIRSIEDFHRQVHREPKPTIEIPA
jgi:hypothetical protein